MKLNRLSLNVVGLNRIGLNRIGKPSRGSSDRPYIDPEVLASLKVVCICYGKSNDDPDRAVVKNLVDPDNPFIISNAAYKLNSGFGLYATDFTSWVSETGTKLTSDKITNSNPTKNWVAYKTAGTEFQEMNVNISGIPDNGVLYFQRIAADGNPIRMFNGNNNIPAFTSTGISGFFINNLTGLDWSKLTIEQIPSFEGAFVTDGVDDLITSTKTVQEMLGGSNEITVVSMIHQIGLGCRTNFICDKGSYWRCNEVANTGEGKTGIYGYSSTNISVNTPNIINNVLGDKVDYSVTGDRNDLTPSQFSVVGYISSSGKISYTSSVAWFWTIIANKVLTTDQINQVIAYFNLDRCVEPTVLYDVNRQGLSNDTPDSDWYLKDFSKNGFDMSLFNFAKKLDSGIGKYATDFTTWIRSASINIEDKTKDSFHITNNTDERKVALAYNLVPGDSDSEGYKIEVEIIKGSGGEYKYYDEEGHIQLFALNESKIYTLPTSYNSVLTKNEFNAFFINPNSSYKVTQIPSHAGALCFDGVEDYGKVTGMPIYKDYTVVTDREIFANTGAILSKNNPGAFVETAGNSVYSFGQATSDLNFISTRSISYLSKYSYCGQSITAGAAEDGTDMWLGTIRDNDSRFFNGAIYSLMTFPYSMSEFLIERQLKKHKLGTLYPNMVEWRPIVKSNLPYSSISYSVNPGEYISVDSMVTITVTLPNTSDKLMEVSCNAISDISISGDNGVYEITGKIVKSPQKINLVISSYLTMLNNETLISNETLIKNE